MTIYTVLAPPAAGPTGPDTDRFVFIKEGFCWPAFIATSIWLLFRRMWVVFTLYLVVAVAIFALATQVSAVAAWLIVMLFGFLVGLEANNLRRWTLERRGYRFVGAASGDRLADAEFRFFSTWPGAGARRKPVEPAKTVTPMIRPAVQTSDIVGLFPKPGGAS